MLNVLNVHHTYVFIIFSDLGRFILFNVAKRYESGSMCQVNMWKIIFSIFYSTVSTYKYINFPLSEMG